MTTKNSQPEVLVVKPNGDTVTSSLEDSDDSGGGTPLPNAIVKAASIFAMTGQPLSLMVGVKVARPFDDNPDTRIIRKWLEKRHADKGTLGVICVLAWGVLSEWQGLPHRTTVKHRELFVRIVDLCSKLKGALEETGSVYFRAGGHGLRSATLQDLLNEEEWEELTSSPAAGQGGHGNTRSYGRSPSIEDLLDRLADAARKLETTGPLHTQPAKHGAKNAYFVRRIGELFQHEYGEKPAGVIAALAAIALGGDADRNLIAKQLK